MHGRLRLRWLAGLFSIVIAGALAGCSSGTGSSGLLGVDSSESAGALTLSESGSGNSGGSGGSDGSSRSRGIRLEARLNPVINVDASGHARLENEAGTANDRFDGQVEIAKRHFARLGIDAADGFQDEVVRLTVSRAGQVIFATRLRFSENRYNDITFEFDIRGPAAPELRAGDVGRVIVNGTQTLRGVFQQD